MDMGLALFLVPILLLYPYYGVLDMWPNGVLIFGMLIGMLIGIAKDSKAKKEGKVLSTNL